jgi:protein-disulfide isomerase
MRALLAAMAGLLVLAASPAPKSRAPAATHAPVQPPVAGDWNSYVRLSATGTYIVGNPAAKVRVVEHLSFTCPHCAAFATESAAVLRGRLIKSGSVMIEYRPAVRDQVDLAATMLVRCIGPKRFADASETLFRKQDEWLPLGISFLQNDARRFALDPPLEQLKTTAQLSGLIDLFQGQGLTRPEIDRCFADQALLRQVLVAGEASRKAITGTPTFFVNGAKVDAAEWSKLEPVLRAKGAQ